MNTTACGLLAVMMSTACGPAKSAVAVPPKVEATREPSEPWLPADEDRCPSGGGDDHGPGKIAKPDASLCLPLVSANCGGGFQGCTSGKPLGDGWYAVPLDGSSTVFRSRVRNWCHEGRCYDVFSTKDDGCDGCMDGKVPDPNCRFEEGRCVSR